MTDQKYTVTFKENALLRLKNAAASLGVPDDQLFDVLSKGIKLIELAEGGKVIIDKPRERIFVNLKKL